MKKYSDKGKKVWGSNWKKYNSSVKNLELILKKEKIAVDISFSEDEGIYLALTCVGPDAPERFPDGGSLSQLIDELKKYAHRNGLKVIKRFENYGEGIDEYTGELRLTEEIDIGLKSN